MLKPTSSSRPRRGALARREERTGWLWVQAWLIGFVLFTLGPIVASLILGFTNWDGFRPAKFIGLDNYRRILTEDPLFWQSLTVTAKYAVLYLPASLIIGFLLALLMNQQLIGMRAFRTIYYLPSVLSGVAVSILWAFVFHKDYGMINGVLGVFGLEPVSWLDEPAWVVPAIVIMSLWGVGSTVIIYLGGLQGIPTELYEVAKLDGAGWWRTLFHVTMPMMSPVFLLQTVLGAIGTLQVFTQAFVLTRGGPNYASYFFSLNIYNTAFQQTRLGYASALSWILFVLIAAITVVIFAVSRRWVFYAGGRL
jgi:multiple sugar transport system permease protein